MLQVTVVDRWALVVLSGDFDVANSGDIQVALTDLVARSVLEVTVDLSEVTFHDVSVLNVFVAAHHRLASVGGRLTVLGASPLFLRMVEATRLSSVLSVFSSPVNHSPDSPPNQSPASPVSQLADGAASELDSKRDLPGLFHGLARALLHQSTVTGDLDRVVRAATSTIQGCDAASVAVIVQGQPRSAVASGRVAVEVDLAQYSVDEGPCLGAARGAQRIRVDVLDADQRYRHFAAKAIEVGIHSTLSTPIWLHGAIIGSLNLYSTAARAFDAQAEALADVLAAVAATAIAKDHAYHAARRLVTTAQHHADDQSDIHRAEGILSATFDCSIEQAEHLLTDTAHTNHETLAQAAQRILLQISSSPPTPPT